MFFDSSMGLYSNTSSINSMLDDIHEWSQLDEPVFFATPRNKKLTKRAPTPFKVLNQRNPDLYYILNNRYGGSESD